MRGKRLLAVGALAGVLALAGCGGDDDDDGSAAKPAAGELSGTVTTWIMDPGSPKLQEVLNGGLDELIGALKLAREAEQLEATAV